MKVLALESSSMVASVAIVDDKKLIAEYILNHKRTHSQKLMPAVEEIMKSVELAPKDIDLFAVANGPGSFTGLRIGLSTVKALAQVCSKPAIGISSLDGLAYNLPYSRGIICPIMDARREQVYTSIYRWVNDSLEQIDEYMALPLKELINILEQTEEDIIFNGDGVPVYRDIIVDELGTRAHFAPPTCLLQRASSVAWLAQERALNGGVHNYLDLEAFYLRKPQAEQKLKAKCSLGGK